MELILYFIGSFAATLAVETVILFKVKPVWARFPALIIPIAFFIAAIMKSSETSMFPGLNGLTVLFYIVLGVCALAGYLISFLIFFIYKHFQKGVK